MVDFNKQTITELLTSLEEYGYSLIETQQSSPLILYFKDAFGGVLKLNVDSTSIAEVYYCNMKKWHRPQIQVLTKQEVVNLQALDDLLVPLYSFIDPVALSANGATDLIGREVLTSKDINYYTSTIFEDKDSNTYNVSIKASPYRDKTIEWVPVVYLTSNWALESNNSIVVEAANVFSTTLGDYIILKPNSNNE